MDDILGKVLEMQVAQGILIDADIKGGRPIIAGTRVPVSLVLDKLSAGATYEDLACEYDLEKSQIHDVLRYAAQVISNEEIRNTVLK